MPDGLYERDALAWAERQASLLRQLAAGQRPNEPVDWANVIEEVQDVGLSELRAVESLLQQAMVHLLKLRAWPSSESASHWREEISTFLDTASRSFSPSMRQRVDLDGLYGKAVRRLQLATDRSGEPMGPPAERPFTLDALLAGDVHGLERQVTSAP